MLGERAIHIDVLVVCHGVGPYGRMHPGTVAMNAFVHSLDVGLFAEIVVSKTADIVHCFECSKHVPYMGCEVVIG